MMTQETEKVRKQMQIVCTMILFHRIIFCGLSIKQLDWSFIYDLVRDTYSGWHGTSGALTL